jgi:hypothetical protein
MVRAEIKSIEITEFPSLNPEDYLPDDFEDFQCIFGLQIGPVGSGDSELFHVTVCTPKFLAEACKRDGFIWGRHRLIVLEYNLESITQILVKFVGNYSGKSWHEVATKVSRIANWEFEDYVEHY